MNLSGGKVSTYTKDNIEIGEVEVFTSCIEHIVGLIEDACSLPGLTPSPDKTFHSHRY